MEIYGATSNKLHQTTMTNAMDIAIAATPLGLRPGTSVTSTLAPGRKETPPKGTGALRSPGTSSAATTNSRPTGGSSDLPSSTVQSTVVTRAPAEGVPVKNHGGIVLSPPHSSICDSGCVVKQATTAATPLVSSKRRDSKNNGNGGDDTLNEVVRVHCATRHSSVDFDWSLPSYPPTTVSLPHRRPTRQEIVEYNETFADTWLELGSPSTTSPGNGGQTITPGGEHSVQRCGDGCGSLPDTPSLRRGSVLGVDLPNALEPLIFNGSNTPVKIHGGTSPSTLPTILETYLYEVSDIVEVALPERLEANNVEPVDFELWYSAPDADKPPSQPTGSKQHAPISDPSSSTVIQQAIDILDTHMTELSCLYEACSNDTDILFQSVERGTIVLEAEEAMVLETDALEMENVILETIRSLGGLFNNMVPWGGVEQGSPISRQHIDWLVIFMGLSYGDLAGYDYNLAFGVLTAPTTDNPDCVRCAKWCQVGDTVRPPPAPNWTLSTQSTPEQYWLVILHPPPAPKWIVYFGGSFGYRNTTLSGSQVLHNMLSSQFPWHTLLIKRGSGIRQTYWASVENKQFSCQDDTVAECDCGYGTWRGALPSDVLWRLILDVSVVVACEDSSPSPQQHLLIGIMVSGLHRQVIGRSNLSSPILPLERVFLPDQQGFTPPIQPTLLQLYREIRIHNKFYDACTKRGRIYFIMVGGVQTISKPTKIMPFTYNSFPPPIDVECRAVLHLYHLTAQGGCFCHYVNPQYILHVPSHPPPSFMVHFSDFGERQHANALRPGALLHIPSSTAVSNVTELTNPSFFGACNQTFIQAPMAICHPMRHQYIFYVQFHPSSHQMQVVWRMKSDLHLKGVWRCDNLDSVVVYLSFVLYNLNYWHLFGNCSIRYGGAGFIGLFFSVVLDYWTNATEHLF